ncbi:methylglutaconyl-CoA hydratase [Paucimonas lemoignei]|uniref:Methylglutaconyl-CoA hydratase n=1 Tax=Paucimonas lemoignei TaxID=29443 RepID=A0A4R3HWA5_PAULE|nr:enoyl-CoA hydratase-related protein [Paucimonas lemoignei]TCS37432.1 methylglutaconyl-CoA hydratase [Paucimonas lemoignei]
MAYRTVDIEHGGGSLATVWLNRPGHGNAIDATMLDELSAVFGELNIAPSLRAIVLAARGPVFCAGVASDENPGHVTNPGRPEAAAIAALLDTIHACRVPVVASVQGDCHGVGMALVAACDIVLAAGQASFSMHDASEPAEAMLSWLARTMPARAVQRYFLTGERFSAFDARQLGLVHEVVAADALDERLQIMVGALLRTEPQALARRRQLLRQLASRQPDQAV